MTAIIWESIWFGRSTKLNCDMDAHLPIWPMPWLIAAIIQVTWSLPHATSLRGLLIVLMLQGMMVPVAFSTSCHAAGLHQTKSPSPSWTRQTRYACFLPLLWLVSSNHFCRQVASLRAPDVTLKDDTPHATPRSDGSHWAPHPRCSPLRLTLCLDSSLNGSSWWLFLIHLWSMFHSCLATSWILESDEIGTQSYWFFFVCAEPQTSTQTNPPPVSSAGRAASPPVQPDLACVFLIWFETWSSSSGIGLLIHSLSVHQSGCLSTPISHTENCSLILPNLQICSLNRFYDSNGTKSFNLVSVNHL